MATTTSGGSRLISEFASQLISQIGAIFENITVSSGHPVAQFPLSGANYVYVLYSTSGMPLGIGAVMESMDRRQQAAIAKEVHDLAATGIVATFRVVHTDSEDVTLHVQRIMQSLFGSSMLIGGSAAAPAKRRGRPRKNAVGRPAKRRGRPRKTPTEGAAAPAKRRGRPRKNSAGGTAAPAKRRGRPRKNPVESAAAPAKRRGRPRKNPVEGAAAPAKRRGRPRKNPAEGAVAAAKRRGRPRKNSVESAGAPARRRGRPRKNQAAAPVRRPGRPRKNPEGGASAAGE